MKDLSELLIDPVNVQADFSMCIYLAMRGEHNSSIPPLSPILSKKRDRISQSSWKGQ